jgi:hypothetical protein
MKKITDIVMPNPGMDLILKDLEYPGASGSS